MNMVKSIISVITITLTVFKNSKYSTRLPAISEDLSFKISQGNILPDPLANLHIRTGPSSSCKEFYLVIKYFIPIKGA